MTTYKAPPADGGYPSPGRELRAALIPLLTALILSAVLVLALAAGGHGV